jgi:Sodium:dicarboxylate symporter family
VIGSTDAVVPITNFTTSPVRSTHLPFGRMRARARALGEKGETVFDSKKQGVRSRDRKFLIIEVLKVPLWLQVLIAMVLGLMTGLLLAPSGAGILSEAAVERVIPWIALPRNIFLALIKMVVIPLVFSFIVLGPASSPDPEFLRKAALRIFPYFVATTVIAVAIGISMALLFKPGRYTERSVGFQSLLKEPQSVLETPLQQQAARAQLSRAPTKSPR